MIYKTPSSILCALVLVFFAAKQASAQVNIEKRNGNFQILRDGAPFQIKGVGVTEIESIASVAKAGGNAIRTWDSKSLGDVLDEAEKHGVAVCAGLWLGHQRHGFDYQNQEAVLEQLDEKLNYVRKYKDHPALLMWAVGNEMEGEGSDPSVWYAVNHIAREIQRIDPQHPTMTVIAELGEGASKIKSIERFCPDIDVIGVNSYGGIESIGERFREAKGSKPYIITEHATLGPWEAGKTAWGSPIESTSTEKGEFYAKGYVANVQDQSDICMGTFAFVWGHKQETTATWFGMLLPDGTKLAAAEKLSELWTGKPPKNRCPKITSLTVDRAARLKSGDNVRAMVKFSDPENDKLRIEWVLRSDSGTIGEGGDPQESESNFAGAVTSGDNQRPGSNRAMVTMPEGGGGYRLFAYVYDDRGGAAVANVPLQIAEPIKLEKVMPVSDLPYLIYGDSSKQTTFIPSGYMGNAEAVSMQLDSSDSPYAGATCIKAEYRSNASWGGVLWQSPAGDWDGNLPGGANLSGATHLEFYARGEVGGEVVNFLFGVLNGNQKYRDTARAELSDTKLSKKWKKFSIPLNDLDMRQIKTGFGWSLEGQGKPVTFYIDDIQYVER